MRWTEAARFTLVGQKKLLRDSSGFDSLVFAKTTRSHVMAWTEITRPQYQRDGLRYARPHVRFRPRGNRGRKQRPGLCPGPAKGTAHGTNQAVIAHRPELPSSR